MNDISISLKAKLLLERHSFKSTHSLGQNFIFDERLLSSLLDLADVKNSDNVLEIGSGAGIMTAMLAKRAKRVLALELDEGLKPVLTEMLAGYENVSLRFVDVLKADLPQLTREAFSGEPFRVVANLPYYITSDIITMLMRSAMPIESVCIMVQKEAAERLLSEPNDKRWCAVAAIVRYFGRIRVLAEVPPDAFTPKPHVSSSFIMIDMHQEKPVKPNNEDVFLRLITACFAMRRKTLVNNLRSAFGISQQTALSILEAAGVSEKIRGEALSMSELARISDILENEL